MKRAIVQLLIFAAVAALVSAESREWTSAKGSKLQAEFQTVDGDYVFLKTADGSQRKIHFDALGEADKKYVADLKMSAVAAPTPPAAPDRDRTMFRPERWHRPGWGPSDSPAPDGVQTFTCSSNLQWSYYVSQPSDFKADRLCPVLFVVSSRASDPDRFSTLRDIRRIFPGLIVAPRDPEHGDSSADSIAEQLRAVEVDVAARYRTDSSRILMTASGDSARHALDYAGEERLKPVASVILVDAEMPERLPRELGGKTVLAGVCSTISPARGSMARFFGTLKGNPSRLIFHSSDKSRSEAFADTVMWAYSTRLKQAGDASLGVERDALAKRLLEKADELKANDKERAYEYTEMAASAAGTPAMQGEASRRLLMMTRDPLIEQYIGARRDVAKLVEKYLSSFGGGFGRHQEIAVEFRKDAERFIDRYPSTSLNGILRQLSAAPTEWRGPFGLPRAAGEPAPPRLVAIGIGHVLFILHSRPYTGEVLRH